MKKDLTLVILAAGMGSRFGGLKQVEPFGPNGEFIIDYSCFDAIKAGFTKIVFIIKEENYDLFRKTIGSRIESKIDVEYVFQDFKNIPKEYDLKDRSKPLGTAHAILCCKEKVKGNFAMINSDDYYGPIAFRKIKEFFDKNDNDYAMVAFRAINTMTENGSVKRGVCKAKDNYLTNIIESKLEKVDNKIIASPLDGRDSFEVSENELVSMNFFGFNDSLFDVLENGLAKFLENNKEDLSTCEYLIPDVVDMEIKKGKKVEVLESSDKWLGVTYKEDKDYVVNELQKLIESGLYSKNLWK